MTDDWTLVIKPKKRLLDLDLKGLWRYRDLWYMYVRRDIVTLRYSGKSIFRGWWCRWPA